MLRFRILASTIPLLIAGVFARSELPPGTTPCVALGDRTVRLAASPWEAQLHVGFTDNPALATVKVQIVDDPAAADFAMADDADEAETSACAAGPSPQLVAIVPMPAASDPVIYLTRDNDADYKVFVQSKTFTARDAAALVVGDGEARLVTGSIGGRT